MFPTTNQTQATFNRGGIVNPIVSSITIELYDQYRALALSMINPNNPELSYIVENNSDIPGAVGYGIHEKFVHYGCSVIDLSVGALHYPWVGADVDPNNYVTSDRLQQIANAETNPLIAGRIRKIANFTARMPVYTKCYYYRSHAGAVKAVTVEDEMNLVKFNMIVSYDPV